MWQVGRAKKIFWVPKKIKNLLERRQADMRGLGPQKNDEILAIFFFVSFRRSLGRENLERGPQPESHLFHRALPKWTENGFR